MAAIRLEFAQFGNFDYFKIYRNLASTNIEDLGQPIGTSSTMYYEDSTVEPSLSYFYRVGVVRDSVEEFSEEINVIAEVVFTPPYNLTVEFKNDGVDRLELNWNLDGFVDEQRYYCSETTVDVNNLPVPKAVLSGDVRAYVDTSVSVDKVYNVLVGSVKNSIEKLSYQLTVSTSRLTKSIKALFSASEKGGAYNFQDLSTLWQDVEATIPVTAVDQFIARVDDISGNGNHLIQANAVKRPQLKQDTMGYYAWFDGSNGMQTLAAANLSGLAQFTFFSRLSRERASSDEVIFESSVNYNNASGSLNFAFNPSGVVVATKGPGSYPSGYVLAQIQSEVDAVYTASVNLVAASNKVQIFRRNRINAAITSRLDNTSQTLTDQQLYLGGRGGSAYFTKTKFRCLVLVGRTATQNEIERLEELLKV